MSVQLRSSHAMLLVLLGLAQSLRAVQAYGTELSQTVSVFRLQELTDLEYLDGRSATRCEHIVDRAATYGSTRVNFMITQYFIDTEGDFVPNSYCWKLDDKSGCLPFTQDAIDSWTRALTQCLQHAVRAGFTGIAFTPHLDAWSAGQLLWRNAMVINPLEKYGGYSYTDIMLLPLARAMNSVMADNLTVWFAVQGEMTAMAMHYPQEHQKLFAYIKSLIIQGDPAWASSVRMGLSNNSNKLCGPSMEVCTKETIASMNYDLPAIRSMYQASDFIGISCYPRFGPDDITTMEGSANEHNAELQLFGIDLASLVNTQGKEFFLSDYGVGGGLNAAGNQPAQTTEEAISMPFNGISGSYTRHLDPWGSSLPSTVVLQTKQYLEDWYKGSALWLSRKGGPTYRVDAAFLWGINSWDTLAAHPTSTTKEGSYLNQDAAQTVRDHNVQVRGEGWAARGQNPGTIAPY